MSLDVFLFFVFFESTAFFGANNRTVIEHCSKMQMFISHLQIFWQLFYNSISKALTPHPELAYRQ